jgi:hypothetical protein
MQIDMLNQYYVTKSIDQNQSLLLNMYLEGDSSRGKYKLVAYPTAGLSLFKDTTKDNVRALLEHKGILYVVAGNTFYSLTTGATLTSLGTLNTSSGFAKIVAITGGTDTNNQLLIIDGTNGYQYNIGTATGQFPITDVDFNQTAADIVAQDDYVVALANNSISYYINTVADTTSWNALDFASKTGHADRIVGLASLRRELYLMGEKTIEVWTNTGNVNFPFERRSDVFIEYGLAAKRSIIITDNSLFFLAKSLTGGVIFARMNGYTPTPVSTPAIHYQFNQLTAFDDCIATAYQIEGHEFIELTFPTDAKTFTVDLTTGVWFQTSSYDGANYINSRVSCAAFFGGNVVVGDSLSGKIYIKDTAYFDEAGTAVKRQFVSAPLYFEGKRWFLDRLQIDVETDVGSSKTFTLEKSRDGGRTWTTVDTYTIPSGGGRIFANRLGSARTWVFRITTTMNAKFIILGFQAEAVLGTH